MNYNGPRAAVIYGLARAAQLKRASSGARKVCRRGAADKDWNAPFARAAPVDAWREKNELVCRWRGGACGEFREIARRIKIRAPTASDAMGSFAFYRGEVSLGDS